MTRSGKRRLAIMGLASGLVALWAADAAAYPQWQLSTDTTRCSQCHFAPAGGGLLTDYGRDATGEELSTIKGSGDFLYGAVRPPSWLAVGGDLRGAILAKDVQNPGGATTAAFPMQADLQVLGRLPFGFALYATGGLRGRVRDDQAIVPTQNYQPRSTSRLISREHWAIWQPSRLGVYVRAGRFYAPFGLRMAEHITYVRRDLGFNQLEESYNVSGGYHAEAWELHLTVFGPDVFRRIGSREQGATAYYEHRLLNGRAALAGQARYASGVSTGMSRQIVGTVAKYYFEPINTLLLTELNLVRNTFDSKLVSDRYQFVGAGGFSVFPYRGIMLTFLGERNQSDLKVSGAATNAATGLASWFPYPHIEVQFLGQVQVGVGTDPAKTFLVQLHYFL